MRIVFMGTPEFAVPSLDILHKSEHEVVAVVTVPDKPAGRGRKLQTSAVKDYAQAEQIPVLQPLKLNDEAFLKDLKDAGADLFVVVAFRMLPAEVWQMPPAGTINLHASLLPQYRGAAPINWALINGESRSGLTTFFINENIDTGDLILQKEIEIGEETYLDDLYERMMKAGSELLLQTVTDIAEGNYKSQPQLAPSELKSAPKLNRENTRLDFRRSAAELYNQVRGLSPYPAAYCYWQVDEEALQIKIYRAEVSTEDHSLAPGDVVSDGRNYLKIACGKGFLKITEAQIQGKKRMKIKDILNGFQFDEKGKFC